MRLAGSIGFPNDDPLAAPLLSERYESSVPGLYVVGALAGYPLIKQAMNQGCEVIFKRNDYSNSFFSILQGAVEVQVESEEGGTATFMQGTGEFFGEIGQLSGRRRVGTVIAKENCVLVETPHRTILGLLDTAPGGQRRMDEVALKRIVRNFCEDT